MLNLLNLKDILNKERFEHIQVTSNGFIDSLVIDSKYQSVINGVQTPLFLPITIDVHSDNANLEVHYNFLELLLSYKEQLNNFINPKTLTDEYKGADNDLPATFLHLESGVYEEFPNIYLDTPCVANLLASFCEESGESNVREYVNYSDSNYAENTPENLDDSKEFDKVNFGQILDVLYMLTDIQKSTHKELLALKNILNNGYNIPLKIEDLPDISVEEFYAY